MADIGLAQLEREATEKVTKGVQAALRMAGDLRKLGFTANVVTGPLGFTISAENVEAKEILKDVREAKAKIAASKPKRVKAPKAPKE